MTIAADKALNTELVDNAHEAVFALRFEGAHIPLDVWDAASNLLERLDVWRSSVDKRAPGKKANL